MGVGRGHYHKWTTDEVNTVRKMAGEGKRTRAIAEKLGLTSQQIRSCAASNGIYIKTRGYEKNYTLPVGIDWSDTELMLLTLMRWQKKSWEECAEFLGRRKDDCRKAFDRHPDYFTERSFL